MADKTIHKDPPVNCLSTRVGARVLFATDEWFACASNLIKAEEPAFDPNAFCSQGKVMDGWETRRKRTPGHDWCIIKLGYPCFPSEVELDTRWFTGNFVPQASVECIFISPEDENKQRILRELPGVNDGRLGRIGTGMSVSDIAVAEKSLKSLGHWHELVGKTNLSAGYEDTSITRVTIDSKLASNIGRISHIRLNYYPDGGVARMKLYGHVAYDFTNDIKDKRIMDLLYSGVGGKGISCSNRHYGVPANLLQPGRGVNMGDGWETARHPSRPGNEALDITKIYITL